MLTPPMQGEPFYLDQRGRYWTRYKDGVALEKDGNITPLAIQGVRWAYRVMEDREGNFWLGTYDQGLYRLIEQAVSFLSLPGPPTDRYVYPLFEDSRGQVWISARMARASAAVIVSRTWQQSAQPVAHCMSSPCRASTRAKNASTLAASSSSRLTSQG